jgi:hypothetical protein
MTMLLQGVGRMPLEDSHPQMVPVAAVVDIGHRQRELEVVEIDEKGHRFHILVEHRQEALAESN